MKEVQVEIDFARGHRGLALRAKNLLVRADLSAHDGNTLPVTGVRVADQRLNCRRFREEFLLLAPDEKDVQQLHAQIHPLGVALDRLLDQVCRLVVQAVGHVEIGFGQRIGLLQIDPGSPGDRIFKRIGVFPGALRRGRRGFPWLTLGPRGNGRLFLQFREGIAHALYHTVDPLGIRPVHLAA